MFKKKKEDFEDFYKAIELEWLETNGLGGWSGSTIIGAHTRRYHGLLVASIAPPTERMVLLSKLDETIVTAGKRLELGINLYPENIIHPTGHQYLDKFTKNYFPEWEYQADDIRLKKTIAMIHDENTVVIMYEVLQAAKSFTLELLPLMAARSYHSLAQEGPQMHWNANFDNSIFCNQTDGIHNLYISVPGATYGHQPRWFHQFQYSVEQYRGLDCSEDLFNHGVFSIGLKQGDHLGIIISTENPAGRNAQELIGKETKRRQSLLTDQPGSKLINQLVLATDQFIVKRSDELKTVIAGYHWFTDWGRDTMISLPGLCLSTGRFDDAKKILAAFAANVSQGMLPNRFQDNGDEPEYNNVDGTLWYFIAIYKYLQATNDHVFVLNQLLPVLKEIIDWHFAGTRYNIKVDEDGLLFAGEQGQQLTWMDARVGDRVVTPRMGKPVEIQALWYNALRIFAELLKLNDQQHDAMVTNISAEKAKDSFNRQFWYDEGNYLYDVIDEKGPPDTSLRPNQLFAISLPYSLIEGEKAAAVLKVVEEKLYTPVGLRSLAGDDSRYTPVYGGDQWHRDSGYHQGTVWSWLLGPYVDALVKVKSEKTEVKKVIENFSYHLNEGCIGSVSEIFDAAAPHHPRGCVAQAWGVAEVLRIIKEYSLHKESANLVIDSITEPHH